MMGEGLAIPILDTVCGLRRFSSLRVRDAIVRRSPCDEEPASAPSVRYYDLVGNESGTVP
jgi:hypothetical protein